MLESALEAGLTRCGAVGLVAGLRAAVAPYGAELFRAGGGIVISASHNVL